MRGDGRRNAPYAPRMMVKVLLYAYATGVFSSRGIARKLEEDGAFRVLGAGNFPQHRTLCEFRRRHLSDFKELFVAVVRLALADHSARNGDGEAARTLSRIIAAIVEHGEEPVRQALSTALAAHRTDLLDLPRVS